MLVTWNELTALRADHADQRIGYVTGSFDLLHGGHLDYIEWAREQCDLLFVSVRSDLRVKLRKGADRPVIDQYARARLVNALKGTAFVLPISDDVTLSKPSIRVASELKPDLVVLGNDWSMEAPEWRRDVPNVQVQICPMPWRESTTRIIHLIRYGA